MKIRRTNLLGLAVIVLLSCSAGIFVLRAKGQSAQTESHTVVYLHGRIYTNDPAQPWADAMAIRDGKIRCVGKLDFVLLECGGNDPNAETIQLKGKFVMPGFNDAHVHLGGAGRGHALRTPKRSRQRGRIAEAHSRRGGAAQGRRVDYRQWLGSHALAGQEISHQARARRRRTKESRFSDACFRARGRGQFARPAARRNPARHAQPAGRHD